MMISDYLHEAYQHIQALLEEYPEIYKEVEAELRRWIEDTGRLRDNIGENATILDQENVVEMNRRHEDFLSSAPAITPDSTPGPALDIPPQKGPKTLKACPKCSKDLTVSTNVEPAPQPGHVAIVSSYDCPHCGYQKSEQVYLPKEIALQEYNLEELMRGV